MTTLFKVDQVPQGPPAYEHVLSAKTAYNRITLVVLFFSFCCFGAALIAKVLGADTTALIALDLLLLTLVFGVYRAMVDPFAPVKGDAAYERIYEICANTEEAAKYRKEVIMQGREFLIGEHIMLLEWHQRTHRSPAYARLYDIEQR